jgi:hypothetical protein
MDPSQLQVIATILGLLFGVIIGIIGLSTALANLRKARYEALKAGVPPKERRLLTALRAAYAWCQTVLGPSEGGDSIPSNNAAILADMLALKGPGLKIRKRRNGTFTAYWIARHDIVKLGFRPRLLAVWAGISPSEEDKQTVEERCTILQSEMLQFMSERRRAIPSQVG